MFNRIQSAYRTYLLPSIQADPVSRAQALEALEALVALAIPEEITIRTHEGFTTV